MGVLRLAFVSALVLEALATLGTAVVAVEVGLRLLYARIGVPRGALRPRPRPRVLPAAARARRRVPRGDGGEGGGGAHRGGAGGGRAARRAGGRARPRRPRAARGRRAPRRAPPRSLFEGVRFAYGPDRDARARRLHARAARRRHRGPAGPERRGQDDGGPAPPAVPRARRRARSPSTARPLAAIAPGGVAAARGLGAAAAAPLPRHPPREPAPRRARAPRSPSSSEAASRARLDARPARAAAGLGHAGGRGRRAALRAAQAQRLALARAFLKDAPVLVLDEPTAQLDPGDRGRGPGSDGRPAPGADRAARRPPPRRPSTRADRVALVAARPRRRGGPAPRARRERGTPTRGSSRPGEGAS